MRLGMLPACTGVVVWLWLTVWPAQAQNPYWQQHVAYNIEAELDTTRHLIRAFQSIRYTNHSPDTLRTFYLLLYANAFKDENTTAMREAGKFFVPPNLKKHERGWIRIDSFEILAINGRTDLPLTAYKVEDTVLEAPLPEPLPPGAELSLRLHFTLSIRKHYQRMGYRDGQYDLAQWYPKVAVYDDKGWHAEPMHLLGEFYGEFGEFEVSLTVPGNFIVAATGVPVAGNPGWQWVQADTSWSEKTLRAWHDSVKTALHRRAVQTGPRTVTFRAENVHDFAWSASADFVYLHGEYRSIPIHVLFRPKAWKKWKTDAVQHTQSALNWLEQKFGPYPYPQVTLVHGLLRGGMEYPMLVMLRSPGEFLIFHEVGHIYFYGILANNELEEPWLDEGLTTFQTKWYMETRYGRYGYNKEDLLKRLPKPARWYRLPTLKQLYTNFLHMYASTGHDEPLGTPAYQVKDPMSYAVNAYVKGAMFFELLRYVVGDSTFERIMREYYRRWQFKHVNEERFRAVCEEISGQDLGWFFEQWLHQTPVIDYALKEVKTEKRPDNTYETRVVIENRGTGRMPVDILVRGASGDSLWLRWQGDERFGEVVIRTPFKPKRVILDPGDRILDRNLLDNGHARFEWRFDLPLQDAFYQPRDTYLLLWRPSIGYNDPDGLRLGGQVRGSYKGLYRRFRVAMYAGLRSGVLDGRLEWDNTLRGMSNDARYALRLQKREGRLEARAELYFVKSPYVSRPPFHKFVLGAHLLQLLDTEYGVLRIKQGKKTAYFPQWQKGRLNRLYFRYSIDPRGMNWLSYWQVELATAGRWLGGAYHYRRVQFEGEITRFFGPLVLHLRGFAGGTFGGMAPLQDQFYIDSASPLERWMYEATQTKGSNWGGPIYRIGGGNVRGYVNQPVSGRTLLAGTAELRIRLPVVPYQVGVFYDKGRLETPSGGNIERADAGITLVMDGRANSILPIFNGRFQIRYDFPLWLSHPLPGEPERKFRWSIGLRFQL